MGSEDRTTDPVDPEMEELREIVPARAVLTELARGFLLAQQSHPERAVRFAETFLKECSGTRSAGRVEGTRPVTVGRLRLGTAPHGAVDPTNFPPDR